LNYMAEKSGLNLNQEKEAHFTSLFYKTTNNA
jgi:hypothetical protein